MNSKTDYTRCMTNGDLALSLAVEALFRPNQTCMKHLHAWRKQYFKERHIQFD